LHFDVADFGQGASKVHIIGPPKLYTIKWTKSFSKPAEIGLFFCKIGLFLIAAIPILILGVFPVAVLFMLRGVGKPQTIGAQTRDRET
jgi:hypothetical protein